MSMDHPLTFGRWMKCLRAELDLTQEALAEAVGCAPQTIRTFESGSRRPSRDLAERLADVLQVPVLATCHIRPSDIPSLLPPLPDESGCWSSESSHDPCWIAQGARTPGKCASSHAAHVNRVRLLMCPALNVESVARGDQPGSARSVWRPHVRSLMPQEAMTVARQHDHR